MRPAALALAAVLLTGCAGAASGPLEPAPAPADPLALVGRWTVSGAEVPAGTSLYVAGEMAVFQPCGVLDADWRADGQQGLFVASSASGDGACFPASGPPQLPWLQGASRFTVEGDERVLRDADGRELARLRPGPRVTPGPNRLDVYAEEPSAPPELQARLAEPPPLPEGEQAPSAAQLQRRWVPVGAEQTRAFLAFDADGAYRGSDGCNGAGGRYALGDGGRLLATSGPSTLIGCAGAPVGGWLSGVARAGLQDDRLVLHAADGSVLGRLAPG